VFQFEVDRRLAALTVYTMIGAPQTPQEMQESLEELESDYEAGNTVAHVFDLRRASSVPKPVIQHLGGWLAANRVRIGRVVEASAVVVRSAPVKLVLTGIFSLQPPPARAHRSFTKFRDAALWAAERLQAADVAVDSGTLAALIRAHDGDGGRNGPGVLSVI